jgi:N-acetylglucosamine kinase-like BadF-type ATPase
MIRADEVVLAVDGGNAKTDLALVSGDGAVLALVRGPGSSPHEHGLDGALERIEALLAEAQLIAGASEPAIADLSMAGVDFPHEVEVARRRIEERGWARRVEVGNDTHALLRAGTDRGWGIAIVCGAGINCLGRAPDRREARFASLGEISGDWGGGGDIGRAALAAAARGAEGRGPQTVLERLVPAHFGLSDPLEVSHAVHLRQIPMARLGELAPVVFSVSDQDPVAAAIVQRLADEVVAFAAASLRRLELTADDPDVVLGGGLLRAASAAVIEKISDAVRNVAAHANVLVSPSEPIVGAALLGLDALGVGPNALERIRTELDGAVRTLATGDALVAP